MIGRAGYRARGFGGEEARVGWLFRESRFVICGSAFKDDVDASFLLMIAFLPIAAADIEVIAIS
jgi:hypothetical protein